MVSIAASGSFLEDDLNKPRWLSRISSRFLLFPFIDRLPANYGAASSSECAICTGLLRSCRARFLTVSQFVHRCSRAHNAGSRSPQLWASALRLLRTVFDG